MLTALVVLLRSVGLICRGHRAIALENLAIRQQLAALTRTVKRPQLRTRDRLFWVLLAKGWREWRTALIVVQPDTVVRWHRQWLRRQWTSRSTRRRPGRPSPDMTVRTLVGEMPRRIRCGERLGFTANCASWASRCRAHGVAAPSATAAPTVTNVADLSHQSYRHAGVDGFLHGANPDGAGAIRVGPAHASAPANCARQHHGTSHGSVDSPTDD